MSNRRWSKFWWTDYEKDAELRMCSLASQGLWMRLLCAMHGSERHGYLMLAGAPPTMPEIAKICGASASEVSKCLIELKKYKVCSIDDDGFFYSRRLVRDNAQYRESVEYGKRGGNPILTKEDNPPVNGEGNPGGLTPPLYIEAEAEREADTEARKKDPPCTPPAQKTAVAKTPRGTRLPADWQPSLADLDFAESVGLTSPPTDNFRDYWHGKAGASATKIDWPAIWRMWCRQEALRKPTAKPEYRNGFLASIAADREDKLLENENPFLRLPHVN